MLFTLTHATAGINTSGLRPVAVPVLALFRLVRK